MKSIVIVGGGTAGWMSAAYLNKTLTDADTGRPLQITLVESPEIGTIGVGEATIPSLRSFLGIVDIPEWRFISATNATFKHGIRFVDWRKKSPGIDSTEYFHPFELPPILAGHNLALHWLALRDRGVPQPPFWEAVSIQPALCRAGKSPKSFDVPDYQAWLPYAYHLDAVAFAGLLKSVATERGVTHIADDVVAVHRTESGDISHVSTRANGDLKADFFVDCSGTRALLIGEALGEPFEDWNEYLLCDSAVVCPLPHAVDPPALRPYTTATAREAGWIWEIDLFARRGNGYVYSSSHSTPERAAQVLCQHLDIELDAAPLRHLKMPIGIRRNMWVRNCLSIGLSAGFIEPLESTGIHFIELALGLCLDNFGGGEASPYFAERFNRRMRMTLEETRDFIQLHYILSDRDDNSFWQDYRNSVRVPDSLRNKIDLWTFKLPSLTDFDCPPALFGPQNYSYILAGLGHLPAVRSNLSPYISMKDSAKALSIIESSRGGALQHLPDQIEYLRKQRSIGRQ